MPFMPTDDPHAITSDGDEAGLGWQGVNGSASAWSGICLVLDGARKSRSPCITGGRGHRVAVGLP